MPPKFDMGGMGGPMGMPMGMGMGDDDEPVDMEAMQKMVAVRVNPADYAKSFTNALPEDSKKAVLGLQGLQAQIDTILQEQALAAHEVVKTFSAKLKPIYERRAAIIAGTAKPTDDEVAAAIKDPRLEKDEKESADPSQASATELRREVASKRAALVAEGAAGALDKFWMEALRNHEAFENNLPITEKDETVLKDLVNVDYVELAPPRFGVALRFTFRANPAVKTATIVTKGPQLDEERGGPPCPAALEATAKLVKEGPAGVDELTAGCAVPEGGFVLVKTYYFESDPDGDAVVLSIDGTDIQWAEGLNPTVEIKEKKQTRGKGAKKQTRIVKYESEVPSFFTWFQPVSPEDEDGEEGESAFDNDFELSRVVRGSIIPRAVEWFTKRACPELEFGGDDEEDEEDGVDFGGEPPAQREPGAGGQPQQECKQQ